MKGGNLEVDKNTGLRCQKICRKTGTFCVTPEADAKREWSWTGQMDFTECKTEPVLHVSCKELASWERE